jgi:hypothetical protein
MKHHIFYINLIKSDILLEKLSTIYNDLSVKDLLTEDTCIRLKSFHKIAGYQTAVVSAMVELDAFAYDYLRPDECSH